MLTIEGAGNRCPLCHSHLSGDGDQLYCRLCGWGKRRLRIVGLPPAEWRTDVRREG